jgi:hypothetical protein
VLVVCIEECPSRRFDLLKIAAISPAEFGADPSQVVGAGLGSEIPSITNFANSRACSPGFCVFSRFCARPHPLALHGLRNCRWA